MMKKNIVVIKIISGTSLALVAAVVFFFFTGGRSTTSLPFNESKNSQNPLYSYSLSTIHSNKWYSSLYTDTPQPLYTLPLVYKVDKTGIGFSYPNLKFTPSQITYPYEEDFKISFKEKFEKSSIIDVSDWSVAVKLAEKNGKSLSFTLAHGAPFTVLHAKGDNITLDFPDDFQIYNNNTTKISDTTIDTDAFTLVTHANSYAVFLNQKSPIVASNNTVTIKKADTLFVGLMDKRDNFPLFKKASNAEILGSEISFNTNGNKLNTTYTLITNGHTPLITLYPHQYGFLKENLTYLGEYKTIRGTLKLTRVSSFTTSIPQAELPEDFSAPATISKELASQIKEDITEIMRTKPEGDNYFIGTWFGKASSLLLLADMAKLTSQKEKLLHFVIPLFIDSLNAFSYDPKKYSLIAQNPGFGNEKLNDHHFHYGYYIRTAAILSRFNPSIRSKIEERINEMVSDLATTDKKSTRYPYFRHFDFYEGHSWADGFAVFTTGNNEESSSEALNAWYGIYLWSKDKNPELANLAVALYSTERESIYYYWFDKNNIYKSPYKHSIASVVWGGKVSFTTWFSDETNMKYGIQLLPFTPASYYLGKLTDFKKYEDDFRSSGGDEGKSWGDLFVMWKSFYLPEKTMLERNAVKKFYQDNPKSLFLYFLSRNAS